MRHGALVQFTDPHLTISQVEVVVGGGGGFGGFVVEHGAVGVAQFFHDGAFVDIGAGEFLAVRRMGTVPGEGVVDVAVAGGGDVAAVAGLGEQQVTVGAVALVGQAVADDGLDHRQGAVGRRAHQAVGRRESAVIAARAVTARDHSPEHRKHNQYDHRQPLHACKDNIKNGKYRFLLELGVRSDCGLLPAVYGCMRAFRPRGGRRGEGGVRLADGSRCMRRLAPPCRV